MNITLISRFIDSRIGGIGTYSELVYDSLKDRNDVNVNVITQEESILPYTNNPFEYFYYSFFELKLLLKKDKYKNADVYHALSPMEAIQANKRKTVATIHDVYDANQNRTIKEKILNKSIRAAIECEKLIVNKVDLIEPLKKYGGVNEDDITIIGPAISSRFHPKPKENDTYTIGALSRLDPRKRTDILIKSFLDADIEDSQLLIAGKGPDFKHLKGVANNDPRVKFLGYISDDEVNDFYNSLDVLVFPSMDEGYGMPIVEAMGCEKPVITLEDGSIDPTLKSKTYITTKEELGNVLENRTYKCDIKKNVEFYKEHSIEKRAEQYLKVYKSI